MMRKILVLGGGGYVGGAILRAIAAKPGLHPIRLTRKRHLHTDGIETRIADARDPAALSAALADIDIAVNAILARGTDMQRATENLCAATTRHQLLQLLHISSMVVYGEATGLVDETIPMPSPIGKTPYIASKIACEHIVGTAMDRGQHATILRPGIVYGPGSQQWIGRLCRLLQARRLGDLGAAGDGFCNLTYADDLAAATLACIQSTHTSSNIFNIATPNPPRWNDVLIHLAIALGATPVRRIGHSRLALESALAVPLHIVKYIAQRNIFSVQTPDPIPPSLRHLMAQHIQLDHRRANAELGFARTPDEAGLAASVAWFLSQGPRA